MLLGAFFIIAALILRRWLAQEPNETRNGFTARSLSGSKQSIPARSLAGEIRAAVVPVLIGEQTLLSW
jgi:hypothetical protein